MKKTPYRVPLPPLTKCHDKPVSRKDANNAAIAEGLMEHDEQNNKTLKPLSYTPWYAGCDEDSSVVTFEYGDPHRCVQDLNRALETFGLELLEIDDGMSDLRVKLQRIGEG